jgi:hypothetical protein
MAIRKITVPKTPKSAYNPDRPASGLLKAQIAMLEAANLSYDAKAAARTRRPKTEGEAARYIQKLHASLHSHLKRTANDRAALTPAESRAALAPRSTSMSDGSKRWPATAGPSVTAQRSEAASEARRPAAVRTPAKRKRKKR